VVKDDNKYKILVLDDDKALLELLPEVFSYGGYESVLFSETADLCGLVRSHQPDLILLDLALNAVIDGKGWCKKLKEDLEFAHIPVLLFTAGIVQNIEAGNYGSDGVIAKPFELDDFYSRIDCCLTKR
jgi:DNA-binding response OmpR family regulator